MHRNIRRFGVEGHVDGSAVVGLRDEQERVLFDHMKDKGYIPVYGLGPYLSLSYDFEADKQKFVCSAYGVFVGSEGVRKWIGVDVGNGRYLVKPTPQNTSETSSTPAASS